MNTSLLMKKCMRVLILLSFVAPLAAMADHKEEFCQGIQDRSYFRKLSGDLKNRLSFKNPGGPIDTGVCWWHARLQRSALYLAVFRPDLPKPATSSEVRRLIHALAQNLRVVEVPGYRNLYEFSAAWEKEFTDYLGRWELREIAAGRWIYAARASERSESSMKREVEKLYQRVEERQELVFLLVKYPGFVNRNHAILVNGVRKVQNGYDIRTIDGVHPNQTVTLHYREGDTVLNLSTGTGAPFIQQNGDLGVYPVLHRIYCIGEQPDDSNQ